MRLRVLFFGVLKEWFSCESEDVDLPESTTAAALLAHYRRIAPEAAQRIWPSVAVAVNRHHAPLSRRLEEGDEVALLPPVSGGSNANSDHGPLKVALVTKPIDGDAILSSLKAGQDGAVVTFDGIVRNHTRGRRTLYLVYEAYEEMALRQMQLLAEQAIRNHGVRNVAIVHRLGRLEIGESSVFIAVASAHRAEAFDACRWLIDTLKKTVTIWKQEYFHDGVVWADGEPFPSEWIEGNLPAVKALCAVALLLSLVSLPVSLEAQSAASDSIPTIRVNVHLVNVFVNVTDVHDAPVLNLGKDDFLLFEDGRPQKIAVFERQSALPLNMVLAIDTSGSVHKDFAIEQVAAREFVHGLLRSVDQLDLMEFSDNVTELVGFTNNPGRIDRGLSSIRGGAATALYSAVYLASQILAPWPGRRVLILISDGSNTVKGTSYQAALEEAVRSDTIVYSIIDVPVAASAGRDLEGEHAMVALSQETGGKYYYADESSLEDTFARLSGDLRTQYLLGYYPPASHNADYKTITVKLRSLPAGQYVLRNRSGYYPAASQ